MGLAEGTETALAAMTITGMSVWSSLGSERLHLVELPDVVEVVHFFADADDAGQRAADKAAIIHKRLVRRVEIHTPPAPHSDYNDYLLADADAWQKEMP